MSLFGEQIQNRIEQDDLSQARVLRELGDAAAGKNRGFFAEFSGSSGTIKQIEQICDYLNLPVPETIPELDSIAEQVDVMLQPSGATRRMVELNDIWWKNGDGPLLAQMKETGEIYALIPNRFQGYHYTDLNTGKRIRITKQNKDRFEPFAYCFYKPLPDRPLTDRDFVGFLLKQMKSGDIFVMLIAAFVAAVIGMLMPFATGYAFSGVIPSGQMEMLIPLAVLLISAAFSGWVMGIVKMSAMARIGNRLDVISENAVYARLIRLPASFFREKSTGGLTQKIMALNTVPVILTELLFGTFLTVLMSVIYIFQLFFIAEPLIVPVFVIFIAEILLFVITIIQERKIVVSRLSAEEENSELVFALLSGIQKIKASGNEKRAFIRWMESYTKKTHYAFRILFPSSVRGPVITAIHMLGMLWIYTIAYRNGLSVSQFTAFSGAFGMVMGGIGALSSAGSSVSMIKPVLKLGEPILGAVPEETFGKRTVRSLNGRISLDHVVFKYSEDSPAILNDISLQIEPGEYVAIVGKSGCGKSTLLRILLGFEEPQQGTVFYDDYDLRSLDKHSLRRNIGTVLQEGKLFTGDIYYNIIISAPWKTMDDAWEAAEKAGMAEDIRRMPMGMHNVISEGGGGISGGQKQRLLIARALCSNPGILMLDEATSALDNITQKIVTDTLNEMKCTRLIIAHRLSTIQQCDRIIVLDHGRIVEDGTYEELMAENGLFTELAKRQIVEEEE